MSVRIPTKIKKELEKFNVNIAEVIRHALEERLRQEKLKASFTKLIKFQQSLPKINHDLAVQFVREERERDE